MLKVWREDAGQSRALQIDLGDPESAAIVFAEFDVHGEEDYWKTDTPVIVVEDADGKQTRWLVEAITDYIAWSADVA